MIFAATMMALVGVFQAIVGLVAVIDYEYFIVTRNYTFRIDTTALGGFTGSWESSSRPLVSSCSRDAVGRRSSRSSSPH
jgi:hypothetical protein